MLIVLSDNWSVAENRRDIFLAFAAEVGFEPLVSSNWYSIDEDKILAYKVTLFFHFLFFSFLSLFLMFYLFC